MDEPRNGAVVSLWPNHTRVPVSENAGPRFLPKGENVVVWSGWWAQRHRDGDVTLTNPNPAPAPKPAPTKSPAFREDA